MTPALLGPKELMARLGLSSPQFYRLKQQGAFEKFRVHPPIGRRCYSAYLVERWEHGELVIAPTFGRKRA